eukprot:5197518-Amphidinium_carterae.1
MSKPIACKPTATCNIQRTWQELSDSTLAGIARAALTWAVKQNVVAEARTAERETTKKHYVCQIWF